MMEEPKWKRFEKLATDIQKELSPNAEVEHDVRLQGHDSGTLRQIDVVVRDHIGQYSFLIVMQCKDEKKPLDVNVVGEFGAVIEDVKANKGVLVSSSGFTKSAINLARKKGIDVFRLVDVENYDWRSYATMPVACVFYGLENYQIKIQNHPDFPSHPAVLPRQVVEDTANTPLYRRDGTLVGTIKNLIRVAWNKNRLPTEIGEHKNMSLVDGVTCLKHKAIFTPGDFSKQPD